MPRYMTSFVPMLLQYFTIVLLYHYYDLIFY